MEKDVMKIYSQLCRINMDLAESYSSSLYVLRGMPDTTELGNFHKKRVEYLEGLVKDEEIQQKPKEVYINPDIGSPKLDI